MNIKAAFIVLSAFMMGILTTIVLGNYMSPQPISSTTSYVIANANTVKEDADTNLVTKILGLENEEQPSPYNWIFERNIRVDKDKVTINVENAQWAKFTDTNSMDPVIDEGTNAIQIVPKTKADIHVGDIVSYESKYSDGVIIHRVVEIGYDSEGWYCIMKGDNNERKDPGRVRFDQIKRITVAIIY